MIYVKTPARILIVFTGTAIFLIALNLSGFFPGQRGALRPVVTGELAFQENPDSSETLRVVIYPGAGFSPGLRANGGLRPSKDTSGEKDFNLDVEFILEEDPDATMRLLEDKRGAHLVWSTVPLLSYRHRKYRHLNPVAVMQYGWSVGEEVLFADEPVNDVAWLKGKTVACVEGGNAHMMILYLLHSNGIDKSELNWRFTASDADAILLAAKKLVRVFGVSTAPEYGVPGGYQPVVSTAQISRLIPGIFITREDILITRKERIQAFIETWLQSAGALSLNSPELLDLMKHSFQSDEIKTKKMLGSTQLSGYRENLSFFGIGQADFAGFDYLMDLSMSLWGFNGIASPPCESLKNTAILASLHDTFKKAGAITATEVHDSLKRPALKQLTGELYVEFPSDIFTPDYKTVRDLRAIARRAHVYSGSTLSLFGVTSSPEDKPHAYHWGMRFHHVTKILGNLGFQKNILRIPELRYDASLSGGGKHLMGVFLTPTTD